LISHCYTTAIDIIDSLVLADISENFVIFDNLGTITQGINVVVFLCWDNCFLAVVVDEY
jgi:hypothetical protein